MCRKLKNIVVVYLLITIVFASVGVRVYASFCSCTESTVYSFEVHDNCCASHSDDEPVCNDEGTNFVHQESRSCCGETSIFVKITDTFLASSQVVISSVLPFFLLFEAHVCSLLQLSPSFTFKDIYNLYQTFLSGKDFLIFIHNLKIPAVH
jgi:hypothetical protein